MGCPPNNFKIRGQASPISISYFRPLGRSLLVDGGQLTEWGLERAHREWVGGENTHCAMVRGGEGTLCGVELRAQFVELE